MKTVRSIAEDVVKREGGYVNDPDDPGGATNFGVTIHTMRRLGLDLDGDGYVGMSDVKLLTFKHAVDIFVEHYFEKPQINRLPEVLWSGVFDMQVNAGNNAIRVLQRLLIKMGLEVQVDGIIGPQTIKMVHQAFRTAPHHLADAYAIERRNYYYSLADQRPKSRKYAKRRNGGKGGWIVRAEEFMTPAYKLENEEQSERTKKWA